MASYELAFKKSVAKDLRSIPKDDVGRILKRIEALRDDPRGEGCVKLSAQERYRVRQGVYRIIYEIYDNELVVMVVKVGHRSAVYGGG
ncbi:MAG TPA: type II toxin-antitoxin system RelE/ParE family toxin [Candidatus Competibacteraceae bacterium]|nr:type II toxin-antitoxin system RelE/ParE family toxin [Candidatus Competibacteraceae bacterium]MCP5134864.1 type II toxin-antitoxin system RelE/ParE family toxin [Gammaproteobacteria bacterium]HPF59119.1 type II toxin-antitoxin system RelE/ParE family toxin [Candidatus Competibacteraceae bacterium]HRY19421.1 type II toxin-antitoxin system RelE/ParE family toxin [Candidatus Competibacteraceae bacterium]